MGPPYLEKLGTWRGIDGWLVDGHWIRDHRDVEFTNGAHRLSRRYVPRGEVWVDRAADESELEIFALHQIEELGFMEAGDAYLRALRRATARERIRRRQLGLPGGDVRLEELDGGAPRILLVDGRLVRDRFTPDFTLGGHGLRYRFIPRGEVWIDDAVREAERPSIVVHELEELRLMRRGMRYVDAHARASAVERRFRRERIVESAVAMLAETAI